MSDELNLIAFNAIAQFMKELNTIFGKKYRPIALYNRLISKTTLMHQNAISRHISVFRDFCTVNRTCILTRNKELKDDVIFYSEAVSIFMNEVFNLTENEEDSEEIKEGIWKHLLTISALVDPSGRAKDVLKKSVVNERGNVLENVRESTPVGNKKSETNFINNIIEKVEKNIDPNVSDPMQAVSSMMKSGVFTDLLSDITNGMKSGELDINKMFSAVNEMVSKEGVGNDESNPLGNHMNMLSSMMSSMNSVQNSEGGGNDMENQIDPMSMLSSMMSSMNAGQNSEGGNDMLSSIMSSFTSGEGSNNIMESMMQNLIQEPQQRDFVNEIEDVE